MGSGIRKYAPIWLKIKETGSCEVQCSREDTLSITNMVRKERSQDKNKPKGKKLTVNVTEKGL